MDRAGKIGCQNVQLPRLLAVNHVLLLSVPVTSFVTSSISAGSIYVLNDASSSASGPGRYSGRL